MTTTRLTRSAAAREASTLRAPDQVALQLQSTKNTLRSNGRKRKAAQVNGREESGASTLKSPKKRAKPAVKEETEDLPHNLGRIGASTSERTASALHHTPEPKAASIAFKQEDAESLLEKVEEQVEPSATTPPKKKANTYGLSPGETPFPDWPHPTPEECHEVVRLLSKVHGRVQAPKAIPMPSLTTSGCGEVPSVLDALIRTRLSAATSGTNSSRAFRGLVQRFGILKSGVGKGSVDWDAVRRADVKEVFNAIKSGGLADVKSKDIKAILQMVYEENQARRAALSSTAGDRADAADLPGADGESEKDKAAEIERAEANVISLDHLHSYSSDDAFNELIKYPGIGPKTASCVLLFCLQRPSFAVDTHVFRLCKWLGWVPPDRATRNSTYAHCEVRIPDELKYPLHQLFIKHGKSCPRCRAITGESSKDWELGCPIDHLVQRSGVRKGGPKDSAKGPSASKRGSKLGDEDSSELSELESDVELGK